MLIFCYLPYSFAEGIHLSGGKRLTLLCRHEFNFNLSLKLYNPEKIHSRCAFFSYVDRDYGHSFLRNCHVTLHPFQLVPRNPNHRSTNVPDPRLFVGNRRLCLFGTGHLFFQPRRPTCLCHMDRSKCMSDRSKKGVFFILALKDVRGQVEWVREWCRSEFTTKASKWHEGWDDLSRIWYLHCLLALFVYAGATLLVYAWATSHRLSSGCTVAVTLCMDSARDERRGPRLRIPRMRKFSSFFETGRWRMTPWGSSRASYCARGIP